MIIIGIILIDHFVKNFLFQLFFLKKKDRDPTISAVTNTRTRFSGLIREYPSTRILASALFFMNLHHLSRATSGRKTNKINFFCFLVKYWLVNFTLFAFVQGCGNTMPDWSNLVPFHSG